MTEYRRMKPCYKGREHHLAFVIPNSTKGDVSLACERCGAVRQFPVKAPPPVLDDMTADEILMRVRGWA